MKELIITVSLNGNEVYRTYGIDNVDELDQEKYGTEVLDMIKTIVGSDEPCQTT